MKAYERYDQFIYEPKPGEDYLYIEWELGTTCNYKCSYCTPYLNNGKMPWLDISNIDGFLKRLPKQYSNKDFIFHNFLGGEVTLWKEFPTFVRKIKEYDSNAYLCLTTNGSRAPMWWRQNAGLFDNFNISIHPEFAKKEQVTENINIISELINNTHVMVSMVPEIWDKCMDIALYIKENTKDLSLVLAALKKCISDPEMMDYTDEQKQIFKTWNQEARVYAKSGGSRSLKWKDSKTGDEKKILGSIGQIRLSEENKWKDWYCNIGLDCLGVSCEGEVLLSQGCSSDAPIGLVHKVDDIKWPTAPLKCKYEKCRCAADFSARKYKIKPV